MVTELIKSSGKTRTAICAEAGISASHLSMIESGERRVGLAKLRGLATALGVPPGALRPDLAGIFKEQAK
jgi:transcriptional regulator with XRE-family HTH domain